MSADVAVSLMIIRIAERNARWFIGSVNTCTARSPVLVRVAARELPTPRPGCRHQAQLVSLLVSNAGAVLPLLPRVLSQALAYRPSEDAFLRISLILSQLALSSFFKPIPYGSVLNGLPTTLNLP